MTPRFDGRVVLVTGAGGGLGHAFAREGARRRLVDVDQRHGTASPAAYLAFNEAGFVTGEIVSGDAGNRIRGWRS